MIKRNLANAISLLGLLTACLLFLDDSFQFIIPLILFNNLMDDLDGIVASKLNIKSPFGAALDNVCDVVSHTVFVLVVGMHFGIVCGAVAAVATASMMIRSVSRIVSSGNAGAGSPTNEMIRHMLFVLLLARTFQFDVATVLTVVFTLHSVSMLVPYRIPFLLRSMTKSATSILLLNVVLCATWLVPQAAPFAALAFGSTHLAGFIVGGVRWRRDLISPAH